jgi:DNA primase
VSYNAADSRRPGGMIPQAFIQDLLNRLDIVDVVEASVTLKRAGANLVACCPFHSEKSPSFTVSPSKQFYHCFGCGAHGNAIGFLMEYSGFGFIDAVRDLAGRVGMTVPEMRSDARTLPPVLTREISEVLLAAAVFYKGELKRSAQAIEYLKGRGLTGEVAASFNLGYAPPGWQGLAAAFPDYRAKILAEAGLVIDGEDGKRYDRFRDRIMFPIASTRGEIVGFGGRVLGQGEPKYLNSPETPVFEKGREVYGLYRARGAIRASDRVIVVEGYMDVVALAQHGVNDAVATLGTATTPIHVQKLLRQAAKVVFCFDGDEAGKRAAWRALENCLGQLVDGKEVAFAFLPQGEDPDSYVRRAGREAFEKLIGDALPLSAFLLRELAGQSTLATEEGRAGLLRAAKPLLKQIVAPGLNLLLRKRIAELAGLRQDELEVVLEIRASNRRAQHPARAHREAPVALHRRLLRCLLLVPRLAFRVDRTIADGAGADAQACLAVLDFIASNPHVEDKVLIAVLGDHLRGMPWEQSVQDASSEIIELGDGFDAEAELAAVVGQIQDQRRGARLRELSRQPLAALSAEDRSELQRLLAERGAAMRAPVGGSQVVINS